ncbi:MAG: CYTH domain-containing protein [Mariprofundus sp.]|nr:CYTH domain-containing protein [Mariprofundus sp.]
MFIEIERKFLVDKLPDCAKQNSRKESIQQGYIILEADRELRIRRKGDNFFLTEKKGSGLCREETEIAVNEEVFNFFWPMTKGMQVKKVRYTFMFDTYQFELDVYEGSLEPLLTLEVEFSSQQEAEAFVPPSFASLDVTNDHRYKNASLAKKSHNE